MQPLCCIIAWAPNVLADSIERGQLELPDKVVRDLHAEAAIMNRMRHPK